MPLTVAVRGDVYVGTRPAPIAEQETLAVSAHASREADKSGGGCYSWGESPLRPAKVACAKVVETRLRIPLLPTKPSVSLGS